MVNIKQCRYWYGMAFQIYTSKAIHNEGERFLKRDIITRILETLALKGELTTTRIAKYAERGSPGKSVTASYFRELAGRKESGNKRASGLVDRGYVCVSRVIKNVKNTDAHFYRLTPFGVLTFIQMRSRKERKAAEIKKEPPLPLLTPNEWAILAYNYSDQFPMLFGKWEILHSLLGEKLIREIELLADGYVLRSSQSSAELLGDFGISWCMDREKGTWKLYFNGYMAIHR